MDGWEVIYRFDEIEGWGILCCAVGVSGNACFPPSDADYFVSCRELFSGLTTGENCDCGSLCTGTVVMNESSIVNCEGECVCSGVCCDDGATCTNAPTPSPIPLPGTAMYCMIGWETLYKEIVDGMWEIHCCAEGVSNNTCFPPSPDDYSITCGELYNLAPGSTCNCGTMCNGTVSWNGTGDAFCTGACSCEGVCCADGAKCTIPYTGESGGLSLSMGLIFGGLAIFLLGGVLYFIRSDLTPPPPLQQRMTNNRAGREGGRGRYNVV